VIIYPYCVFKEGQNMDYLALKNEILGDSKSLGYIGKEDYQIADLMNTIGLSGEVINRGVIPSYEIIDATVPSEWTALTATEKQRYQTITGAGQCNSSNANIRAAFQSMFAAGTQTRINLTALLTRTCSRAEALGFGSINHEQVAMALRGGG
jgi:hypothetical protein